MKKLLFVLMSVGLLVGCGSEEEVVEPVEVEATEPVATEVVEEAPAEDTVDLEQGYTIFKDYQQNGEPISLSTIEVVMMDYQMVSNTATEVVFFGSDVDETDMSQLTVTLDAAGEKIESVELMLARQGEVPEIKN